MGRKDNIPKGIITLIAAMIVFASQDAFIKHLAQSYHPIQLVWVRFMFLPFFALAVAWRRGGIRANLVSTRPWLQIVRCAMLLADMLLFVMVMQVMPLADAHALISCFPLMVIALSALFLGEEVGPRRWAAVGVCFIGVLVILRPGITVLHPAAIMTLTLAGFFSVYTVMTRVVSRTDTAETSLLYLAFFGLLVTTVVGPFFWTWPTPEVWGLFAILSVLGAIGHFLMIQALELAPASVLQPYNYVLLLWATLIGFVVFGQFPDVWTIVGSAIIVVSGLYAFMRERQAIRAS